MIGHKIRLQKTQQKRELVISEFILISNFIHHGNLVEEFEFEFSSPPSFAILMGPQVCRNINNWM